MPQLSAGLDAGEFSSEELTRALLERIEQFNPSLNAFITVTDEAAPPVRGGAGYGALQRKINESGEVPRMEA